MERDNLIIVNIMATLLLLFGWGLSFKLQAVALEPLSVNIEVIGLGIVLIELVMLISSFIQGTNWE